jgi:thiamine biosynthesis lipoprotein
MSEPNSSTRREFLQGKPVRDVVEQGVVPGEVAANEPFAPPVHTYQLQFARSAMACEFAVYLNAGQYESGPDVALAALDLLEELEQQLSVYRESSELSQINRSAADGPVTVEARLFDLLARSMQLFEATHHAFDITSGPLTKVWGFFRRQGAIPTPDDLRAALERIGSQYLRLDAEARTIEFLRAGVELNLGSIGKGYTLDRCAEQMVDQGVGDFLWHGGQSSVLARGSCGNALSGGGWTVGVANPLNPQQRLAEVQLKDQALGTSGASVQFFRHRGKRYGHILDPRTGWPAEGVFSSTVIAPTAAEADALATAFYVLGVEQSAEYCRQHPEIAALLTIPSRSGSRVELVDLGLKPEQWQRAAPDQSA